MEMDSRKSVSSELPASISPRGSSRSARGGGLLRSATEGLPTHAPQHDAQGQDVEQRQADGHALQPADFAHQAPQLRAASQDAVVEFGVERSHRSQGSESRAFNRSTGVLGAMATILVTLWSGAASADTRPFVEQDQVLRGPNGSHLRTIDVAEGDEPAQAEVALRYSSRIDAERSVATLVVDGSPRASASLTSATEDGIWSVSLGRLAAGSHTVEVSTRLVPLDDACTPDEQGSWAVVEDTSSLTYRPAPGGDVSLQGLPESWRLRGLTSIQVSSESDEAEVMQARVLADHLVRDWGFVPDHDDELRLDEEGVVSLHTLDGAPGDWSELTDALADVDAAPGVVGVTPTSVRVLARSASDLPWVTEVLRNPEFRRLCGTAPRCLVGPPTGESAAKTRTPSTPGQVMLVGPEGWEGRGEGSHTLSFEWSAPAGASIERWPMVHLPVRWSGLGRRGGDATLNLRIAGRSVATYDLSEFEPNETTDLAIRIPKAWWSLGTWPLEVTISLRPEGTAPCEAVDPGFPWVSIDPTARLQVPHTAGQPTGIAGWYETSLARSAPVQVSWSAGGDAQSVAQVASVLYPLSQEAGGPGFAFSQGADASLVVRSLPSAGEPVQALAESSGAHLFAAKGYLGMPMLDTASVAYLAVAGGTLEFVPATGAAEVPVPPMGGLSGLRAVTVDDQWEAFDVPAPSTTEVSTTLAAASLSTVLDPITDPAVSIEERTRRMFDLLWLIGSALILGAVVLLLRWRATR